MISLLINIDDTRLRIFAAWLCWISPSAGNQPTKELYTIDFQLIKGYCADKPASLNSNQPVSSYIDQRE